MVNGEGAAVGLTENPSALQRWIVSGQETTRAVNEFEKSMKVKTEAKSSNAKHHEEIASAQLAFA